MLEFTFLTNNLMNFKHKFLLLMQTYTTDWPKAIRLQFSGMVISGSHIKPLYKKCIITSH